MGVSVQIDTLPVEVSNPIRFDRHDQHGSYDPEAVTRFWHVLRLSDFS
jgi:hypothetical protein